MPGYLLHVAAVVQCTHQAPCTTPPNVPRVFVSGQPVATVANVWTVAGCPFQTPTPVPVPSPCVRVQWAMPATRILVGGSPALLQSGVGTGAGLCLNPAQVPQGPPVVSQMQLRTAGM